MTGATGCTWSRSSAASPPSGVEAGEDETLAPLGLRVAGEMVFAGRRDGRPIEIVIGRGGSQTALGVAVPEFEIRSEEGKLVAGAAAPAAVGAALSGLRKAKRWRGVEVSGGAQGIVVSDSLRGERWLYDLWLAETLASRLLA